MATELEEFLEVVTKDFNNKGKFLYEGTKESPGTKARLLEAIYKMRKAKMPDADIIFVLEYTFNNAYVEHEKQLVAAGKLPKKEEPKPEA